MVERAMELGPWVAFGIFAATQLGSAVWLLATMKSESRIVKLQIAGIQAELDKLGNVLVALADFNGRMALYEERQLAQGKRVDELSQRVSLRIDRLLDR